jgi:hypothetical protein
MHLPRSCSRRLLRELLQEREPVLLREREPVLLPEREPELLRELRSERMLREQRLLRLLQQ